MAGRGAEVFYASLDDWRLVTTMTAGPLAEADERAEAKAPDLALCSSDPSPKGQEAVLLPLH